MVLLLAETAPDAAPSTAVTFPTYLDSSATVGYQACGVWVGEMVSVQGAQNTSDAHLIKIVFLVADIVDNLIIGSKGLGE